MIYCTVIYDRIDIFVNVGRWYVRNPNSGQLYNACKTMRSFMIYSYRGQAQDDNTKSLIPQKKNAKNLRFKMQKQKAVTPIFCKSEHALSIIVHRGVNCYS